MKTWIAGLVFAGLGLGFGFGVTQLELAQGGNHFWLENRSVPPIVETVGDAKEGEGPKAFVVDGTTYDFGTMNAGNKSSHIFQVKNVGTEPLKLKLAGTTCKCTVGNLKTDTIMPGEIGDIELGFETLSATPDYQHGASIDTNDPALPTLQLIVMGSVIKPFFATPEVVLFNKMTATETRSATLGLYTNGVEDFEVNDAQLLDPKLKDYFEIEVAEMPAAMLADMRGRADGGKMVTIRTKPGMPFGPFQQTLRFTSNATETPLDVPISGTVVGNISLAGGKDFNPDYAVYRLGIVEREKGAEIRLLLLVRGEARETFEAEIVSVEPDGGLIAKLGEANKREKVTSYPLTLTIPPNALPVSRLGDNKDDFGFVVIKTNDERTPELKVRVAYAVQ